MERITLFLNQILRHSFLSKREKAEWIEEMNAHLHASIEHFKNQGYSDDQAVNQAFEQFGSPVELRDKLTKETYGYSSKTILWSVSLSLILLVVTLVGSLVLHGFSIHNKYIELLSVVFITCLMLSVFLVLTRKRKDRICLMFTPLLFALGYLQAYFHFLVHSFGDRFHFLMFENLFFSGVYDMTRNFSFNFKLMLIGSLFLIGYSFVLFFISKNRYISVLPVMLSIVYTVTHLIILRLYYFFFLSVQSPVFRSYDYNLGDSHRIIDIALKLVVLVLLFVIFGVIEKRILDQKRKAII